MTRRLEGMEKGLPLYQRVRDQIAQGIGKTWRPGDAIPSEAELARTHRVALGTLRKALDILVAEGLLERFQGKGTFVRRANFNASLFRFFRFKPPRENGGSPKAGSGALGHYVSTSAARTFGSDSRGLQSSGGDPRGPRTSISTTLKFANKGEAKEANYQGALGG
jgi:DNA-binding transcriptional MocR family regulator